MVASRHCFVACRNVSGHRHSPGRSAIALLQFQGRARLPGSCQRPEGRSPSFRARAETREIARICDQAFYEFEEASRLVPQNVEYLTAREMTRQHLAGMHLQRGNSDLLDGRQVEALAEFRTALNLDPQNEFAQQRISDALGPAAGAHCRARRKWSPAPRRSPLNRSTDATTSTTAAIRAVCSPSVAASYGLTVIFDDTFASRRVRFDIENADFATALQAASAATKSFSVALEDTILFASADTPENHRSYDRMGMRSFYIAGGDPAKDLNDLMNTLRTLFEFKFVNLNAASSTITVRGPKAALEAATQFLEQFDSPRPEVMLDLKVFQVSHTYMRNDRAARPGYFQSFQHSGGRTRGSWRTKHPEPDQPTDCLWRYQPSRQSDHFRPARAIARPAEFHLQPAARDLRRRAHAHGP